jgi:Ser/Thr protein kinase RdoA (MazF antagonist)
VRRATEGEQIIADGMAERSRPLEDVLLGTRDPAAVVDIVSRYCADQLGSEPARFLFHAASVGAVYGMSLTDGRRVVVKIHHAAVTADYLRALQELQRHAAARDLPAPMPLAPPMERASALITAESMLDAGAPPDPYHPRDRDLMARGLARFVAACRDFPAPGRLRSRREVAPGEIWPPPHDIRFDFPGTSAGAEWIDALGARALERMRRDLAHSPKVLGHADWRREHLRVQAGRLCAIYDWDSVAFREEPLIVAAAMRAFPADWSIENHRQYPTLGEMRSFLVEYERERAAPFSEAERATLNAAIVYGAAYTARCEHSDRCTDFGDVPAPTPVIEIERPANGWIGVGHISADGCRLYGYSAQDVDGPSDLFVARRAR